MAGFNLSSTTPGFSASNLNTTPTFGTGSNQQNVSFAAAASSTPVAGGFGTQSQFGLSNTPTSFALPTIPQNSPFSSASTVSKPTFGATAFGTPSTASTSTGLTFGVSTAGTTSQPNLTFGNLNSNTTAKSQPQLGLSFGASTVPSSGISLASKPTLSLSSLTPSGTGINISTTSTQSGLSLGTTAVITQPTLLSQTSTAPSTDPKHPFISAFASTSQSTPSSQTTLSFGASTSSTAPTSLGTATTSAPTLFGIRSSSSTTSATTSSSSFGLPVQTTSATATSAGVFSWQKTTTDTSTTTTTTTTPPVGLGGVFHSAVASTQASSNTVLSVKEQPLPNEIQQTVNAFKDHVRIQKNLSSEVARSSSEPLSKLSRQIETLSGLICNLGNVLSQQKFTAEKIKLETIRALNDYELTQKIKNSPVASDERMLAVQKYFSEKISAFEKSTKVLLEKIEYVYQHVITLPQETSLSADALKLIIKKLHDSFLVIGARAYKLHNEMQLLKVQYMTLRNQYVTDDSSISFSTNKELQLPSEMKSRSDHSFQGPNPFSRSGNGSLSSLLMSSQSRNFPQNTTSAPNTGVLLNTAPKPLGFLDTSTSSLFNQSSSLSTGQQFNLQKPPTGNKRGKR